MNWPLFALGLVVALLTVSNVIFTMVLPRRPYGLDRISLWINRGVLLTWNRLARLARNYERKDAMLATAGPSALVFQLLSWSAGLTVGFGLMIAATHHTVGDGLLQALTAVFTVGATHGGGATITSLDIPAGAIWVVIVALQIAYLPTLYASFSRREGLVALLESRAGLPSWGPEVLTRHQLVGITDTLPSLYAAWEEWAADVAETHTTYPVLLLFRSPEPWYSWLVGLLAVLDAAAMHLALAPSQASSSARLCLRMGFTMFQRVAVTLGWPVELDPDPDGEIALSFEEYARAVDMLVDVGFPVERSAEQSWADFRGWRMNYEALAYRLCDRLTAPWAPWSGPRRHLRGGPVPPRRPPQRKPGEDHVAFPQQPNSPATVIARPAPRRILRGRYRPAAPPSTTARQDHDRRSRGKERHE